MNFKNKVQKNTYPYFLRNAGEELTFYKETIKDVDYTTPGGSLQSTVEVKKLRCVVMTNTLTSTNTQDGHQISVDTITVRTTDNQLQGFFFKRFNVKYRIKSLLNTEGHKEGDIFLYHYVAIRGK